MAGERACACVCLVPQAGWLGLAGLCSGCNSSLEVFVDAFHTEEACLGVDCVNSSLLYVLMALLRQYARDRDPPSAPGERTQVLHQSQAGIPKPG